MQLKKLIGRKIKNVYMSEEYLKFETDDGDITYAVEGDCCSTSVFYDFHGALKLINNGVVTDVEEINLDVDEERDKKQYQESIEVYGYKITSLAEDGELDTSVFSFRNYSNGYYGGSMYEERVEVPTDLPKITSDFYETE